MGVQRVVQFLLVAMGQHVILGIADQDSLFPQPFGDELGLGLFCLVDALGHEVVVNFGFVGAYSQNKDDASLFAPSIDGGKHFSLVGNGSFVDVGACVVG